jgi:hypothetical protein
LAAKAVFVSSILLLFPPKQQSTTSLICSFYWATFKISFQYMSLAQKSILSPRIAPLTEGCEICHTNFISF